MKITFFALFLFLLAAKNVDAAVLSKPSPNLGLVGYWSFNEGTTTTALDYSGNKNKGTLTNGPTWVDGKRGKALNFDGVDDFVDLGNTWQPISTVAPFTVSGWLKVDDFDNDYPVWINLRSNSGIVTFHFSNNVNYLGILFGSPNAAWVRLKENSTDLQGDWVHVAITYNGEGASIAGNFKIYKNGLSRTTSSAADFGTSENRNLIGSRHRTSVQLFWDGLIDEVRVYNRALTPSEIEGLYKSGAAKFTPPSNTGLVGYWSFNEGTSTIALDYSGNKNKGTLVNGPKWVDGKRGKALNFDGVNDYVDVGLSKPSALNLTGPMSISLWFKTNSVSGDVKGMLCDVNSGQNLSQFCLEINRTAGRLDSLANGGVVALTSNTTLTVNTWYHVVLTRSGSAGSWTHTIYLNGVSDGSAITASNPDVQQGSAIGRSGQAAVARFDGSIDEVRVYNRALSAQEVWALYNSR